MSLLLETIFKEVISVLNLFLQNQSKLISSRQKKFPGIRSRPAFVATIRFAFSNNLSTFQEIVDNRPGLTNMFWMIK